MTAAGGAGQTGEVGFLSVPASPVLQPIRIANLADHGTEKHPLMVSEVFAEKRRIGYIFPRTDDPDFRFHVVIEDHMTGDWNSDGHPAADFPTPTLRIARKEIQQRLLDARTAVPSEITSGLELPAGAIEVGDVILLSRIWWKNIHDPAVSYGTLKTGNPFRHYLTITLVEAEADIFLRWGEKSWDCKTFHPDDLIQVVPRWR